MTDNSAVALASERPVRISHGLRSPLPDILAFFAISLVIQFVIAHFIGISAILASLIGGGTGLAIATYGRKLRLPIDVELTPTHLVRRYYFGGKTVIPWKIVLNAERITSGKVSQWVISVPRRRHVLRSTSFTPTEWNILDDRLRSRFSRE